MIITCNPFKYNKRIYYTLSDSAHLIAGTPIPEKNWNSFSIVDLNSIFTAMSAPAFSVTQAETIELWEKYLWPSFNKRYIAYIDLDIDEDDSLAEEEENYIEPFNKWWGNFYQILNITYDRYVPLIKLYKAQSDDLMSRITATTTTTNDGEYTSNNSGTSLTNETSTNSSNFNDVPTNYGNYNSADYNTSINGNSSDRKNTNTNSNNGSGTTNNTQTTNVDNTNLIPIEERLKNIRDKWENLYEAWADEFNKLFMLSVE